LFKSEHSPDNTLGVYIETLGALTYATQRPAVRSMAQGRERDRGFQCEPGR
jgi:hypothetical protein